ncbi:acyl-CoA desaturase [Catalinimonas sp. 4WD22]|uniref:fatty acid desaturase family protein n=1 Tax=Catalinimonas locisalis TaxID=3133978 RepID=UPI003101315B
MKSAIKFINKDQSRFFPTLRQRVNAYFKENNISPFGNHEMIIKTAILLGLYILSYLAILILPLNAWLLLPFALLMGISKAGVGMTVMHDALHGSYSKNTFVNKLMGNSIYLLGANADVWKIQHNVLHHTYTNIHGVDEDISTKVVIRLSKQSPLKKYHHYQHIYVFFLYGLMTLLMLVNDFFKMLRYHKQGLIRKQKFNINNEYSKLLASKVLYLFFVIGLPILLTSLLWWQVLIGFVVMHLTAGFILSVIFQMAHVVEGANQPIPDTEGNIENAWAVHELQTTADFAPNNRFLNWYIGGLNFQIEHHLFPNICHVHYPKIAHIVKQTAEDFQLDYNVKPNFIEALKSHVSMLKMLGQPA